MQHYEFTASSSLSKDQLEVFALYQMVGLNVSNDKFQRVDWDAYYLSAAVHSDLGTGAVYDITGDRKTKHATKEACSRDPFIIATYSHTRGHEPGIGQRLAHEVLQLCH